MKPMDAHHRCAYGGHSQTIEGVTRHYRFALVSLKDSSGNTHFDILFQNVWGKDQGYHQLICLERIPRLMSDFNIDPDTSVLLSKDAVALFGSKTYPGCNPEQCFKLVCYIDVSSFLCINDTLSMEEGDKPLKYYARKIGTVLKQMVKSEWKPNDVNRKLYGTTHRVGGYGYKFVIIITGVLAADDPEEEVPNEINNKLKSSECGLASIEDERGNVFTFFESWILLV